MMLAACGPAQLPGREGFTDTGVETETGTSGVPDLPEPGTETETGEPECVELVNFGNTSIGSLEELEALDGVTRIEGNVEFIGEWGELPEDLAPLRCLEEITGFLYIHDTDVRSFVGLDKLRRIGGYLYIGRTFNLQSFEGLGALRQIGSYLEITENFGLVSTAGSDLLVDVGDFISVSGNPILQDLAGFASLPGTNGQLRIEANGALTSLAGLESIKGTKGDLAFVNNFALVDTSALAGVQSIGGSMYWLNNPGVSSLGLLSLGNINGGVFISQMSSLANLDDLFGLYGINNSLYIWESGLENIDGLGNLEYLGGDVWIENNPQLNNIDGLSSLVTAYNSVRIDMNPALISATGLESLEVVGGGLSLWGNPNLTFISLANLQTVADYMRIGYSSIETIPPTPVTAIGGDLNIHNNTELITATGFFNLQSVGGDMFFNENPVVETVAFPELTQLFGRLIFIDNDRLRNLDGFTSLGLAEGVILRQNAFLNDISGLSGLTSLPGSFKLVLNGGMINLAGVNALAQVGGDVEVSLNGNLTTISGLTGLNAVGGTVTVSGNDDLPTCVAQEFVEGINFIGGGAVINGNQADACGG